MAKQPPKPIAPGSNSPRNNPPRPTNPTPNTPSQPRNPSNPGTGNNKGMERPPSIKPPTKK